MQKIAVIGPVSKDIIEIRGRRQEKIGGTAYYTSYALHRLGAHVTVFTKLSREDRHLLDIFPCKVIKSWSRKTTMFRNIYPKKDSNYREQFVESVSDPFSVSDVKNAKMFNVVHLGTLNKTDISVDVIEYIRKNNSLVSLDIQGCLRKIINKKVCLETLDEKNVLENIDIIKCDIKEAEILAGKKSIRKNAEIISSLGPREVIITCGYGGSFIYSDGKITKVKAVKPRKVVDATGAGDVYMAGYLFMRLKTADVEKCGRFASTLATLGIERRL